MPMVKNILFIVAIGLAVVFSGCAGTGNKSPQGLTPAVEASGYQISLGARTLADCISFSRPYPGTTQPCSLVNLDIRNNNPQSLDVALVENKLVLRSGVSKEMLENVGGLSAACARKTGLMFRLGANSDQNIGICYPLVSKSDAPTLEITVMVNGTRTDYSFDLDRYGLT